MNYAIYRSTCKVQQLLPEHLIQYLLRLALNSENPCGEHMFQLEVSPYAGGEVQAVTHRYAGIVETHKVFGFEPLCADVKLEYGCLRMAHEGEAAALGA